MQFSAELVRPSVLQPAPDYLHTRCHHPHASHLYVQHPLIRFRVMTKKRRLCQQVQLLDTI